jgi:predicted site-specific integrase-resolvase
MAEKRAEPLKPLAASFGASYDTFFRAAKDGRLKTIRLGNRLYVPSDEIERLSREGLPRRTRRAVTK